MVSIDFFAHFFVQPCTKSGAKSKSGAKTVGKQLFHTGVDILNDISQGDDIKAATKRRFQEALENLTDLAIGKSKATSDFYQST